MKLLQNASAIVSLMLLAVGVFRLWRFGLHGPDLPSFVAASVSTFVLIPTSFVFHLRATITASDGLSLSK